ncbi:MAG TPA: thioredoxin-dependent thiol peroxidase [Deltaproteobacteria bacterium]|nr:thioredoxin-dependent thiol peroxidase [Deltaproteobacteria bacterium]
MTVEAGDRAPDFKLRGIDGDGEEREFTLASFSGRRLVLYFYPRDNTPGCTAEACDFRDRMDSLRAEGVEVAGVSPDSTASHLRFREKQGLNFPLLSDPDRSVAAAYGAYGEKKSYGRTTMGVIRSTFLIGADGRIERVWRNVKARGHAAAVAAAL